MTRRSRLAGIVLTTCLSLAAPPAHALFGVGDIVFDPAAFAQLVSQVQQLEQALQIMSQQLTQAEMTVRAVTNIPHGAIGSLNGLFSVGLTNPLSQIVGNLSVLQHGTGTGTCVGADAMLSANRYYAPGNANFAGAWVNNGAVQSAGLMACTQQMLRSLQTRMDTMPGFIDQLQNCADVTCTSAMQARIAQEQATVQSQQTQMVAVGNYANLMQWNRSQLLVQKQQADEAQIIQQTGGTGTAPSGDPGVAGAALTDAPLFSANGG